MGRPSARSALAPRGQVSQLDRWGRAAAARSFQTRGARSDPHVPRPAEDLGVSGSLPPALRARPLRGGDSAAGRSGAARWAPSPSPSRVSGSLGRGRAGPLWDAFQAQREDLGYSLFLLQAKRGAQPGKGAGLPGGLVPGSGPEVPPSPETCPGFRPSGTRKSCGSRDTLPASRFVAQASRGLARSAKGSKPESRGLPSRSARLPSWGSPRRSWGGKGAGPKLQQGAHPLSSRPVVATTVITAPWPSASRARARAADRACRNPAIRSHFNDYYYISDDCKNSLLFSVCG